MTVDERYMQRALALAERGRGRTSPNPMVGCVIVRDGVVLGEGHHEKAGAPHAEVNAIAAAGDISGATVYVTLEPCCHVGKTPPCVDLLLEKRPARVVVAMQDPNPLVSGKSLLRLQEAGIEVQAGVLQDEARRLNEVFCKYIVTRTPFVVAKCAMTLDGKIATRTGDSRWVTGEASRHLVHELRNQFDGILVGSRTVMLDNPSLTTRLPVDNTRDPVRIIMDADSYLDPSAFVFHTGSASPTWVAVPEDHTFDGADEVLRIPSGTGGLDVRKLMEELGAREITSVLIEGGGTTLASAFEAGIVDKVLFFVAPKIIGGKDAITAVEGEGCDRMDECICLERMRATPVGEDILIEAYVKKSLN